MKATNLRNRLPHWGKSGIAQFVTFRLRRGKLRRNEIVLVAAAISRGHNRFYTLYAAIVMPDHCHLLLRPRKDVSLSRIVRGIKGTTARAINQGRGASGSLWQKNYFDRLIRGHKHFDKTIEYMMHNPRKAGLVIDPWEWPGWVIRPEEF